MAKSKKRKRKSKSIIPILLIIIVIVVLVVVCIPSYNKSVEASKDLEKAESFISSLSNTIEDNINLEIIESDYFDFTWKSTDENLLTSTGVCNRPAYSEGDKSLQLLLEYKVKDISFIDNVVFSIRDMLEGEFSVKITITKLPMTETDKVNLIHETLELPDVVYTSIGLVSMHPSFDNSSITWSSSNTSVISNDGITVGSGEATLTATITVGDTTKTKKFTIKVNDNLVIEEMNYDFTDYSDSTYDDDDYGKLKLNNAKSEDGKIKFNLESEKASIVTGNVLMPLSISFTYEYAESSKGTTYTKSSFVKLYTSLDNETWIERKVEELKDSDNHTFSFDFDKTDCYIKLVFTSDYSDGSKNIMVDDFKIKRALSKNDIIKEMEKVIPSSVSEDIFLPMTTSYGGIVKYSSSSSDFTNLGAITKRDEAQTITLTVTVSGFDFECIFEKDVIIAGIKDVVPVEIRFIDVGKYGHSDCGESIYIKYGNIDVLIDAGDNYHDTERAVKEVIDAISNDKVLDYVIATHPDSDHIGSMDYILEQYEVKNIITFMGDASSGVYTSYKNAVDSEGSNVCKVLDSYNNVNGCTRIIELGPDVYIEIINTQNYETSENNSRSVVCVLNAYGKRSLFTGDADTEDLEYAYMQSVGNIDLLKAVHHGTRNGTYSQFLEAVDPEYVIVTNGNYFGNKHGHPTYEALKRMYDYDENMKVYAVVGGDVDNCEMTSSGSYECSPTDYLKDRNGTITVIINNNGIEFISEYFGEEILEIKDTEFWAVRSAIN